MSLTTTTTSHVCEIVAQREYVNETQPTLCSLLVFQLPKTSLCLVKHVYRGRFSHHATVRVTERINYLQYLVASCSKQFVLCHANENDLNKLQEITSNSGTHIALYRSRVFGHDHNQPECRISKSLWLKIKFDSTRNNIRCVFREALPLVNFKPQVFNRRHFRLWCRWLNSPWCYSRELPI